MHNCDLLNHYDSGHAWVDIAHLREPGLSLPLVYLVDVCPANDTHAWWIWQCTFAALGHVNDTSAGHGNVHAALSQANCKRSQMVGFSVYEPG